MQNFDVDLLTKLATAIVLGIIVVMNIRERRAPSTPLSAYMWREQPLLWMLGLALLTVLVLFTMVEIAVRLGWLATSALNIATPVLGLPMALLSLSVIVLGARAALKAVRQWQKP